MLDVITRDLIVVRHEAAHCLLASLAGFTVLALDANPHRVDDALGRAVYLEPNDADPAASARVAIAGLILEPSLPSPSDERDVRAAWARAGSPRGWIGERANETLGILDDHRRTIRALVDAAYADLDRMLDGVRIDRIVNAAR